MDTEKLKTLVQGAVAGGAIVAIGLFWSGMAVTSGSAETMARDQADAAVVEQLAPICVAQFALAENRQKLRDDLEASKSWEWAKFVKSNGWATMPGSDAPRDDIARACAELIVKLGS